MAARASSDLDGAFPEIVDTYGPAVYTTALRVSRQPADADDLAAETFVRAYKALRGYSSDRICSLQLRPWLITIALNLWRNQLRDAARRPNLVPLNPSMAAVDPDGSPEQAAVVAVGSEEIEVLLAALPDVQRAAVVLRHVVGLKYAEIAVVLDAPAGTVKSHVSRGLNALRARLRPEKRPDERKVRS